MPDIRDIIATILATHEEASHGGTIACTCGWRPSSEREERCGACDRQQYVDHIADLIAAALRDAGHLLPDHADRIDPTAWPAEAEGITVRAIRTALPNLQPSAPTVIARRIMADLAAAGLLLTETGTNWHVVVKTVPSRDPELMAEIVAGADALREWLADLRNDPDRDRLATFTGYRLTPAIEETHHDG